MTQKIFTAVCAAMLLALATSNALADPVNVNTASAEQIAEQLTGVGITKARAIVAYRNANGRFTDLKALTNVTGIGERTLELNKGNIIIELPKQTKSRQK